MVIKIEISQIEKSYSKHIDNKTKIYYDIFTKKNIAKFTYYDYLYIEKQKTIQCLEIRETVAKYEVITSDSIHNIHDKTYRKILDNKDYATHIINEALNLKKPIEEREIEKYTNRYVTGEYMDKETDVVYKMKNKEIFFLIEHQSKVDYSMSFRLEEYKLEIMKSAIDKKKIKTKGYEIPIVIPIVLYTGREKWTVGKKLNKVQDERLEKLDLQQYNLIDIGKYTQEKLLKSNQFIDKIFLIEKAKNVEELTKTLQAIVKQVTKEDKNNLISIIRANFAEKIGQEKLEELIKEMKGEDEDMLGCVEMVWEEAMNKGWEEGMNKGWKEGMNKGWKEGMNKGWKEGMNKGWKEGKKERSIEIAMKMKKNNLSTELIQKITGLTKQVIENMKV